MILKELEQIVFEHQQSGVPNAFIRNTLKEYLQVYLLYFVYSSSVYSQDLVFTGGTCLRHFYDLERLSEDVDFDSLTDVDTHQIGQDIKIFFKKKYRYNDVQVTLKQQGQQLLLKFPVLKPLGLATKNESDLLYVKMDISKNPSRNFDLITTSKSRYGFNFVARHYDLPSLMAGKIHAILKRQYFKGTENTPAIKGRDFYDLLWYLKKSVKPNYLRLWDMLGEVMTKEALLIRVDDRIDFAITQNRIFFEADLIPLVRNADVVPLYVQNYLEEYNRCKGVLLRDAAVL